MALETGQHIQSWGWNSGGELVWHMATQHAFPVQRESLQGLLEYLQLTEKQNDKTGTMTDGSDGLEHGTRTGPSTPAKSSQPPSKHTVQSTTDNVQEQIHNIRRQLEELESQL